MITLSMAPSRFVGDSCGVFLVMIECARPGSSREASKVPRDRRVVQGLAIDGSIQDYQTRLRPQPCVFPSETHDRTTRSRAIVAWHPGVFSEPKLRIDLRETESSIMGDFSIEESALPRNRISRRLDPMDTDDRLPCPPTGSAARHRWNHIRRIFRIRVDRTVLSPFSLHPSKT